MTVHFRTFISPLPVAVPSLTLGTRLHCCYLINEHRLLLIWYFAEGLHDACACWVESFMHPYSNASRDGHVGSVIPFRIPRHVFVGPVLSHPHVRRHRLFVFVQLQDAAKCDAERHLPSLARACPILVLLVNVNHEALVGRQRTR